MLDALRLYFSHNLFLLLWYVRDFFCGESVIEYTVYHDDGVKVIEVGKHEYTDFVIGLLEQ